MLTKKDLRENLLKMREKLCVYGHFENAGWLGAKPMGWVASKVCKCHYGGDNPGRSQNGSGCPELLDAAALLSLMTDREYAYIMKRAKKRRETVASTTEPTGC